MNKEIIKTRDSGDGIAGFISVRLQCRPNKRRCIFNAIELDHRDMINEDESEFVPVYLDTLVGGVCAKKMNWIK